MHSLMHPFMPFVTEELWQRLPNRLMLTNVSSIMIAAYPTEIPQWSNKQVEADMELIKETIHGGR